MMESILLIKMIPKMGDLYNEEIPKRGDCQKENWKTNNGNWNNSDFHQVSILL